MSLATLVQSLSEFAEQAENAYDEDPAGAPESAAVVLAAIRDLRADLASLAKRVEADLIALAGEKRFTVPLLGEVEVKRKTKRTAWQHDRLLPALLSRIMDEPTTIYDGDGTLLPYVQIGHNVANRLRECVGFGAGKVTGIRAIGLTPDEFCKEEADGYGVKLPPRPADVQVGEDDADS